jgi:microcystin-dependent protein
MAEVSRFYGYTDTDPRSYAAADIAPFFIAMFGEGGVASGKLSSFVVSAHSPPNMSVDVAAGMAWVRGYFVKNDAPVNKTIATASGANPRIDRVVLRNTFASGITIEVLPGSPAGSPSAPGLTTDGSVWEISLAQVYVAKSVTQINPGDITDERTFVTMKAVRDTTLVHFDQSVDLGNQQINNIAAAVDSGDLLNKTQYDDQVNYSLLPTGTPVCFGTASIPTGFLLCNGSAVSRVTYAALYAVIGIAFGYGDGSTTFNLPNMTGRIPIGLDPNDADFDTMGKTGGATTVTLDLTMVPSHNHIGGEYAASFWTTLVSGAEASKVAEPTSGDSASTGGGGAHENLPPYLKLAWGIRI